MIRSYLLRYRITPIFGLAAFGKVGAARAEPNRNALGGP